MAAAAILGAIFTFLGLALIAKALHHTKIAAQHTGGMLKQTELATRVAEGAAIATRDIGENQTRAYVSIPEVFLKWDVGNNFINSVEIIVANTGHSPALRVSIDSFVLVLDSAELVSMIGGDEFRSRCKIQIKAARSGSIASAGSRKAIVKRNITNDEIVRCEAGEIDIVGYVCIK